MEAECKEIGTAEQCRKLSAREAKEGGTLRWRKNFTSAKLPFTSGSFGKWENSVTEYKRRANKAEDLFEPEGLGTKKKLISIIHIAADIRKVNKATKGNQLLWLLYRGNYHFRLQYVHFITLLVYLIHWGCLKKKQTWFNL